MSTNLRTFSNFASILGILSASAFGLGCATTDGGPDTSESSAVAESALQNAQGGQTPANVDCSQCRARARLVRSACLATGGELASCNASAHLAMEECADLCIAAAGPTVVFPNDPEPATLGCEETCKVNYEDSLEACIESGTGEDCDALALGPLDGCIAACAAPADPSAPSCEDQCDMTHQAQVEDCVNAGGEADICEVEMKGSWGACLASCAVTIEAPSACDASCQKEADEQQLACVKDGGKDAECAAMAGEILTTCAAACPK